jgi:hypothetical protein
MQIKMKFCGNLISPRNIGKCLTRCSACVATVATAAGDEQEQENGGDAGHIGNQVTEVESVNLGYLIKVYPPWGCFLN